VNSSAMSREQQTPPPPRRFMAIPFSSGCRSHSSVDVVDTTRHGKKPHPQGACARANWPTGSSSLASLLFCSFDG